MADCKFLENAIQIIKRARDEDEGGNYSEAYKSYILALDYFMMALKYEKNDKRKAIIRAKTAEYLERAETVKSYLGNPELKKKVVAGNGGSAEKPSEDSNSKMKIALENTILQECPNVRWDDVIGLLSAKEALKEAVILPIKFPHLFVGNRQPWHGILLYGPPGTGKSFLAKAVATEASAKFFSISSSDLLSKWLGESEKLVRQLFALGQELKPSIIFIDEIDSLCSVRNDSESESTRRVKTEFLIRMNGVGNDLDGILVLAATNVPWLLDSAIRRRFEKRIYIGLPDESTRSKMFQMHLGDTPNSLSQADYKELASFTEGYSGSDIAVVVREALMRPIRMVQSATHFKNVVAPDRRNPAIQKTYWEPCSPGDPEGVPMSWMDIEGDALLEPLVTISHLFKALKSTKPTINSEDLNRYTQFTAEFGQDG
ncbi:vacuolar protein sorting-associated protein 4-like [Schistocerca gregaria]|uniref:vacuolar protein sorting-associated protein 4-like n=1 Tax=Schistocerca gregaria TaxID=7010 RepID=UPI00211E37E0|nr:vacuolar protein sorting-associated protein 4-like [Schistocerca gregaria]